MNDIESLDAIMTPIELPRIMTQYTAYSSQMIMYIDSPAVQMQILQNARNLDVLKELATYSCHREILEALETKQDIRLNIALLRNENLPADIIDSIVRREKKAGYYASAMQNPNISEDTLAFIVEQGGVGVKDVAKKHLYFDDTPLGKLASELGLFMDTYLIKGRDDLAELCKIDNEDDLCTALLGKYHDIEKNILFSTRITCHFNGYPALLSLRAVFRNSVKNKLDRHNYLGFLKRHSQILCPSWMADTPAEAIKMFLKHFGEERLYLVALSERPSLARDVLRMLHFLLDEQDPRKQRYELRLIKTWLQKNNDYGKSFHDYLVRKERRKLKQNTPLGDFPQRKYYERSLEWRDEDAIYRIYLPCDHDELITLGKYQSNCVGGHAYAQQLLTGGHIIFALCPLKDGDTLDFKKGFTYQFNRNGICIQAESYNNGSIPEKMVSLGYKALAYLKYGDDLYAD